MDDSYAPSMLPERLPGFPVLLPVACNLPAPELLPGGGPPEQMTVMPVPEASVYKNDRPVLREQHVGLSGQPAVMQPVPEPSGMQGPTDEQFGSCVFPTDTRHHATAGFRRDNVRHWLSAAPLPQAHTPDPAQPVSCRLP